MIAVRVCIRRKPISAPIMYYLCFIFIHKLLLDVLIYNYEPPLTNLGGSRGSIVLKALCYKLEGRWLETRCGE
jgi:hypothetical protein